MKKSYMRRWAICICAFVLAVSTVTAQKKKVLPEAATPYFTLPTATPSTPTEDGFLQRWMLLEPISAPVRTNTVFTDSYLREKFYNDYLPTVMFRPHQQWTVSVAEGKGGSLGTPYYKICIAGTTRCLTATADGDVVATMAYTGDDAQLWRIDQLTDGTYRIMPKAVPGTSEPLALVSLGDCTPALAPFDFSSDNSKWNFRKQ